MTTKQPGIATALVSFAALWLGSPAPLAAQGDAVGVEATVAKLQESLRTYYRGGRTAELLAAVESVLADGDARCGDDAAYLLAKSEALGALDRHEEARVVFARVPDRALVQPHHVFNRMQERIETDPAACIPLIRTLGATANGRHSLADWLHHSYGQSYAPTVRDAVRSEGHAALRDALADPSDPNVSGVAAGFVTYARAALVADDASALQNVEREFAAAPGSRALLYRLLLSRLDERHAATADRALATVDAILAELEATDAVAAEPAVERRARTRQTERRYLLATAHWLRSRFVAGDVDAERAALQRAAELSFTWRWRSAYGSFYDRVLLGAKPEYRTAYAEFLERAGEREAALRVRLETALAEPDRRGEAETLFAELHADDDFDAYFVTELSRNLPDAPAFALKTPDGDPVSLDDYRGKWLLLEFWGTW